MASNAEMDKRKAKMDGPSKPRDFNGAHGATDHKGSGKPGTAGFQFLGGGPGRSHGMHQAGSQTSGTTGQNDKGSGKFIEGGHGNHMFGRSGAGPAPAGETSYSKSPARGPDFAQGGKTHMFGRRGSQTRSPGDTGGM